MTFTEEMFLSQMGNNKAEPPSTIYMPIFTEYEPKKKKKRKEKKEKKRKKEKEP
jgi:hypothetical protein